MPRRTVRPHTGMTLIFVIAMLALMSVLSVSFAGMAQLERQLGGNYVFHVRARLAAESGMAWAQARLMDLPPNAVNDVSAIPALTGDAGMPAAYSRVVEEQGAASGGFAVTVDDESAKLNLNNQSGDGLWQAVSIVLAPSLGSESADAAVRVLRDDGVVGRAAYPGARFPGMAEVDRALRQAGLGEDEIAAAHRNLTVDSWMDPDVIGFDAVCRMGSRYSEVAPESWEEIRRCDTNYDMQALVLERSPRAPVNVNAAPVELLQALIQPLRGVYLDERGAGPENKSTDHYGWSSFGDEAPHLCRGVLRRTLPFTADQASRLARALHDRVHGVANPDLAGAIVEGPTGWSDGFEQWEGDHAVPLLAPGDRFETWDEFREFLENGLTDAAWRAIFVGEGGLVGDSDDGVTPACQTAGFVDPHASLPPLSGDSDANYNLYYRAVSGALWNATGESVTPWDTDNVTDWWDRYYVRAQMDLLLAMFNPNTQLNDFNPNQNLFLMVDKPQVTVGTTELCFDSTGVFSIASRGLCVRRESLSMEPVAVGVVPAGDCLARHEIHAMVRAFDIFRLTTQAQLLNGVQTSGPENPSNVSDYFSQVPNHGGGVEVAKGPGGRFALQAYPQPLLAGREEEILEIFQDGCLMPATLETQTQFPTKSFLCAFNGDSDEPLDPDLTSAPSIGAGQQWHSSNRNYINSGLLWQPAAAGAAGGVYPDGVYCEENRVYALKMLHFYNPQFAHWQSKVGTLAFWVKPNFHPGIPTAIHKIVTGPSQRGHYAGQQFASLYFLPNAASNEAIGRSNLNWTAPLSRRCADMSVNGVYHGKGGRNYWVPTRSLAFGFAWQRPSAALSLSMYRETFALGMVTSPTVTRDFSLANNLSAAAAPSDYNNLHRYAMPGRQWTLIQLGWDVSSAMPRLSLGLGFNTCMNHVSSINRFIVDHPYRSQSNPTAMSNWDFKQEWLRFGELPRNDTGIGNIGSRYYADATIDEVFGLGEMAGQPWTGLGGMSLANRGRYLCKQAPAPMGMNYVAWYQTPAADIGAALGAHAGTLRLRSVAWTLYRPRNNRDPILGLCNTVTGITVNPNDPVDPVQHLWAPDQPPLEFNDPETLRGEWDPISVDIREPGTEDWYFEAHNLWTSRLTYPGGSVPPAGAPVEYRAGDAFQLKLHFHYNEPYQRVYEPPVLDDITCTFALSRAEILRWREE